MTRRQALRTWWALLVLTAIAMLCLSPAELVLAQDDFSIPGLDEPVKPAPAEPPATTGTADPGEGTPVAEDSGSTNLFGMIKKGGWAMWPLGVMSMAIVALAIFLISDLTKKNFTPNSLVTQLGEAMDRGDIEQGVKLAESSPSCLGQVMNGALRYVWKRGYGALDQDTIYDLMADASQNFNRNRAKTLNYLSVISQAAPMLGLLGTVSGMIKAFASLERAGLGNPKELAGNISEALVTTATGLIVALPAIFLFFVFRDKLADMVSQTELEAARMLDRLRDAVYSQYDEQPQQQGTETAPAPAE